MLARPPDGPRLVAAFDCFSVHATNVRPTAAGKHSSTAAAISRQGGHKPTPPMADTQTYKAVTSA